MPQTTANYFEIRTNDPTEFINELKTTSSVSQLINKFPGLMIDQNVLIIKNIYTDSKDAKKIHLKLVITMTIILRWNSVTH